MTKFINWTCVLAAAFGDLMRMQRLCELRGEAASRLQDAVLRLTKANFRGSAVWKKRAAKQSMLQLGIHKLLACAAMSQLLAKRYARPQSA